MTYSASVHRLLISCPGDVPHEDLSIIQKTINRWNGTYGDNFGAAVIPISWGTHAAADFGSPPQQLINRQLVEKCDICIAIFANRLGTPTASAESGTAEEIENFGKDGRYVGVLRSVRDVNPTMIDLDQARKLNDYLSRLGENALILEYATDAELSAHVDAILVAAISRNRGRADVQIAESHATPAKVAEIWPKVESSERVKTSSKGELRTSRSWYMVLTNTGDAPARNVRFHLEPMGQGEAWMVIADQTDDQPAIEILAPGTDMRFNIAASFGSATQMRCTVAWIDDRGEQENIATLRLA